MEDKFDKSSFASEVQEHLPASRPVLHPVLWSLALVLAVLGGAILYLLDVAKVSPSLFTLYAGGVFALSFFSLGLIYAVLKRKADAEISDRFWRHTRDRVSIGRLVTMKPTRGNSSPGCHSTLATTRRGLSQLCA